MDDMTLIVRTGPFDIISFCSEKFVRKCSVVGLIRSRILE